MSNGRCAVQWCGRNRHEGRRRGRPVKRQTPVFIVGREQEQGEQPVRCGAQSPTRTVQTGRAHPQTGDGVPCHRGASREIRGGSPGTQDTRDGRRCRGRGHAPEACSATRPGRRRRGRPARGRRWRRAAPGPAACAKESGWRSSCPSTGQASGHARLGLKPAIFDGCSPDESGGEQTFVGRTRACRDAQARAARSPTSAPLQPTIPSSAPGSGPVGAPRPWPGPPPQPPEIWSAGCIASSRAPRRTA